MDEVAIYTEIQCYIALLKIKPVIISGGGVVSRVVKLQEVMVVINYEYHISGKFVKGKDDKFDESWPNHQTKNHSILKFLIQVPLLSLLPPQ